MENHQTAVSRFVGLPEHLLRRSLLMPCLWGAMTALLCTEGCASARHREPVTGPLTLDGQTRRGQQLFMKQCHQCHPGGEAGLAPSLNNKPLPSVVIKFQVRYGLGAMPAFSKERLTDDELTDIIAYLQALRQSG